MSRANARSVEIRSSIARVCVTDELWRTTDTIKGIINRDPALRPNGEYLSFSTLRYHLEVMVKNGELERRVKWQGCYSWAQYRKGENIIPF